MTSTRVEDLLFVSHLAGVTKGNFNTGTLKHVLKLKLVLYILNSRIVTSFISVC